MPYAAHADTLVQIRAAAQGKIVVDTTVPLSPPKGVAALGAFLEEFAEPSCLVTAYTAISRLCA